MDNKVLLALSYFYRVRKTDISHRRRQEQDISLEIDIDSYNVL